MTTSLGRELTSGNQDEQWKSFEVKADEEIAGLCVAFGLEEGGPEVSILIYSLALPFPSYLVHADPFYHSRRVHGQ
jgi:hypothetical protein